MPESRYTQLDRKLDKVLAEFSGENGIHAKLGRMDERQIDHGKRIDELVGKVGHQNGRVGKLEGRVWWIIGIGSATALTVGAFLAKVLDKVMQ